MFSADKPKNLSLLFYNKTHKNASRKEPFLKSVKKNFRRRSRKAFPSEKDRRQKTGCARSAPRGRRNPHEKVNDSRSREKRRRSESERGGGNARKEKYLSKTLEGTCRAFDGTAGHYFVDYFFIHTHLRHRRRIQGYVL